MFLGKKYGEVFDAFSCTIGRVSGICILSSEMCEIATV